MRKGYKKEQVVMNLKLQETLVQNNNWGLGHLSSLQTKTVIPEMNWHQGFLLICKICGKLCYIIILEEDSYDRITSSYIVPNAPPWSPHAGNDPSKDNSDLDQGSPNYGLGATSSPPQDFIQCTATSFFERTCKMFDILLIHYMVYHFSVQAWHCFFIILIFLFCFESYRTDYKKSPSKTQVKVKK